MADKLWALLNSAGDPLCDYEGILSVSVTESSQVLSEPLENGKFASYNKVQAPNIVSVQLAIGSDPARQVTAMEVLADFKAGTETASLYTPAKRYENLALTEIGQSRSQSDGATLLIVDLQFQEVRSALVATTEVQWSPKSASSADPVDKGRVSADSWALSLNKKVTQ